MIRSKPAAMPSPPSARRPPAAPTVQGRAVSKPKPPAAAPPVYRPAPAGAIQAKALTTSRQVSGPPVYRPEAPGTVQPKSAAPKVPPVYRPNPVQARPVQSRGAIQRMHWVKSGQDIKPVDPSFKGPPKPPIPGFHEWEDGDVWNDQTGAIYKGAIYNLFARKAEAYRVHNEAL